MWWIIQVLWLVDETIICFNVCWLALEEKQERPCRLDWPVVKRMKDPWPCRPCLDEQFMWDNVTMKIALCKERHLFPAYEKIKYAIKIQNVKYENAWNEDFHTEFWTACTKLPTMRGLGGPKWITLQGGHHNLSSTVNPHKIANKLQPKVRLVSSLFRLMWRFPQCPPS